MLAVEVCLKHADRSERAAELRDEVRLFEEQDALSPSLALSPIVQGSACRMTARSARRL